MSASGRLRVAIAQFVPGPTVAGTAQDANRVVRDAATAGAGLVVFPELCLTGYDLGAFDRDESWVSTSDPRIEELVRTCRTLRVATVLGAAYIGGDGRRLLAALFVGEDGTVTVYGKQHLHGRERDVFDAGGPIEPIAFRGWAIGLAVCFDAAVPAHAQRAADAGADLYVVSSFYTVDERDRMAIHMASRAMDHRMYTVAANFAQSHPHPNSCGGSGVWGPDGVCSSRADAGPTVLIVDLDHEVVDRMRRRDGQATGGARAPAR